MAILTRALFLSVLFCVIPWLTPATSAQHPGYLWWEGENPVATNVPNRSPFGTNTGGDFSVLSGNDWISGVVQAGGEPYAAGYKLDIPAAGTYTLWARKFWKHGPYQWRFGQQDWTPIGRDIGLIDTASIRTHIGANWTAAGSVTLDAGPTVFAWRMIDLQPGKDEGVAFDAFLLVRDDGPHAGFIPGGKRKPDQRDEAPAPAGWFTWDPAANSIPDDPEDVGFDLRRMNEPYAGVNGRVTTTRDGQSFQLGDGRPVRFWGVNVQPALGDAPDAALHHWARKLAKFGVNLVRIHGQLWTEQQGHWRIDPRQLDKVHRIVAACKRVGIYTKISWYFPVWVDARHAGFPGYAGGNLENPFAAVFFDEHVQDWYFQSLRDIATPPNPYTGLSLADDPAVALFELVNEDSLFFWTFKEDNLPPKLWNELEEKYEASPHYVGGTLRDIWHLTRDGLKNASSREKKQAQAQAAFLAETQRAFYERGVGLLRELEYDGLVICSNWHTADAPLLDALERWTYTAGDVTDHHGYYEGRHQGSAAGWAVRPGDVFESRSALDNPVGTPLRVNQAVGHPAMISEIGWPHPNAHQAEMPLFGALAIGVQGVDAITWFVNQSPALNRPDLGRKFSIDSPQGFGSFPAAALLYRAKLIAEQEPVIVEPLASAALKQLSGSQSASAAAFDALRAGDVPPAVRDAGEGFTRVPWVSAFVGPVLRAYDDPDAEEAWNDPEARLEAPLRGDDRSFTLTAPGPAGTTWGLQHGRRLSWSLNPDAGHQAHAAFLIARPDGHRDADTLAPHIVRTDADSIHYAQVALDGDRRRVLMQLMTSARPRGFAETNGHISAIGTRPWQVRAHQTVVRVPFDPEDRTRVTLTALDANGNRTDTPVPISEDGKSFTWPDATLYVLAERRR